MAIWSTIAASQLEYSRIDADFYQPRYLTELELWKKLNAKIGVSKLMRLVSAVSVRPSHLNRPYFLVQALIFWSHNDALGNQQGTTARRLGCTDCDAGAERFGDDRVLSPGRALQQNVLSLEGAIGGHAGGFTEFEVGKVSQVGGAAGTAVIGFVIDPLARRAHCGF